MYRLSKECRLSPSPIKIFSDNTDSDELILVPAVSFPHIKIPKSAASEGDIVEGVGQYLEQDTRPRPACSFLEESPPHTEQ